ncbi:MAG: TonB-dependent receptor [Deltaproteobacteria bacterium]|nr:TonB-dependent receptor [Deltaproteobacteria bacterium]
MKALNRITLFKHILLILPALSLLFFCGTAFGQEEKKAAEEEFTLEEIVVTAEFREKGLQSTPLSITAVNADTLEMRNQTNLAEISMQAPNVSLRPGNASYGSSLVAYVRGVGQTDFNPSVEAGVGIYVDDVYYSTITGNILDLVDLERVEILRGPQGTLAGRNAIGGAIKLFSKKPDDQNEGFLSLTMGDFGRIDLRGATDFTITDKLFARISGASRNKDGYVKSYDYACYNNLSAPGTAGGLPTYVSMPRECEIAKEGGQSYTAGRLALRYVPNDNFEINFSTNIVRDKSEAQPNVLVAARDNYRSSIFNETNPTPSGAMVPIYYDNGNIWDGEMQIGWAGQYDPGVDIGYDSRFVTGGTYMNYSTYMDDGKSTPDAAFQGGNPGQDISIYKPTTVPRINYLDSEDYNLSFDWRISEDVSLKSITSYREYTNTFGDDADGAPLALQQLLQRMVHDQWTQEVRLNAGLFDGFADTTIGIFYLDQQTDEDARVDINYSALDFAHGPDTVPAKSKAAYGQAVLHLTDLSNLTLGLRYSEDEKTYTFQRHNPDGSAVQPPAGFFIMAGNPSNSGVFGVNDLSSPSSSERWDWRAAFDYKFTEKIMGYAQIATGYKAGGSNARPFYPGQIHAIDPEELTNYEIGVKSTLFDQLRLNASVFYNDYKDIQLPVNRCVWAPGEELPCAAQTNVGDAEVKGFELEGVWRPNTEFLVDFSYAYLDFEYTKIDETLADPSVGATVTLDMTTPYTPENKFSIGAQYRFDLGNMGDLTPRIDYSYQSKTYSTAVNTPLNKIDSYGLANARLTWRSEDIKWQASLEVTNITDEYYYLTIYDLYDAAGYISGQPGHPREWALTIKRTWYFD